jgi:Tol biopolymer transport system component
MTRTMFLLLTLVPSAAIAAQATPAAEKAFTVSEIAWEAGDYPSALRGFERILSGPDAARYRERIATITGEPFATREITTDGRAARFSSGGKWLAFERGPVQAPWTILVRTANWQVSDSVQGSGAAIDDTHDRVALLRAVAGRVRLVVRDIGTGRERLPADTAMLIATPQFGPEGNALYVIGKAPAEPGTQVYAIDPVSMTAVPLTSGDVPRADLTLLPGGRALVYVQGRDPFAGGGRGGRGGRGGGRGGAPLGYVLRDIASGAERAIAGTALSASADGAVLAWLTRDADTTVLRVMNRTSGATTDVKRTTLRLDAPAVSPDGRSIAFQLMLREDWEVFAVDADGTNERRLTTEIQHDVLPRWIDSVTVLSVKGEPRHRRSYAYDARTGARTRLFHNNTVRTVAPEYEWSIAAGGRALAIVAERDGDTVSPERGVYVMDLAVPVSTADVLARVRSQLRAEESLRAGSKRRFADVAATIRPVTESVSRDWIYRYAANLFSFGSKHVTQPGNAKAIAYLDSAYRSFGYQPVLQWFQPGNNPRTANVLATLRGTTSPDVVYVVASHFDSRAEGPGADDNSSGTTMLLETARVLAQHPLPATVIFASFTGEEAGLLGSREFVRQIRDSLRLVGAMNNDMMGWSNDQRLDNTIRYSNPGIRDVQHGAALEFSTLITYDALYYKSTDAAAFYEAYGDIVGGFGSYPILGNPHYHQPHDVLETINFVQVTENTRANVATVMLLAMTPSRVAGVAVQRSGSGLALTWTPNPERDIRDYLVRYRDSSGAERTVRAAEPRATLPSLPAGTEITVKAVNQRGLEGWDWGRVRVP